MKQNCTVVLGNFDGVHKGHQQLIKLGRQIANKYHEELTVFTFHPQRQEIVDEKFCYLLNEKQKKEHFYALKVDKVTMTPFEDSIANLSPEAFVHDVLLKQLHARHVIVGFNYTFGYKGSGTPRLLTELCAAFDIEVIVMEPYHVANEIVSSTAIRNYLKQGNVERANMLLGYPYGIEGVVEKGQQIGRTIGFPTANIRPLKRTFLPGNGVYAVKVYIDQYIYLGILNIGIRPTVQNTGDIHVEVHLIDFDDDIYNKEIRLEFYFFLRKEMNYVHLDNLKQQLEKDKEKAIKLLLVR